MSNRTFLELGSTPGEEPCAQTIHPDYETRAHAECNAYIGQLYRFLAANGHPQEALPEGFALVVRPHSHDFGTYYQVAVQYNDEDEKSCKLAYFVEGKGPGMWDDEARKVLGVA